MIIVLFGAKSTGKSTLAMGLEKRFQNTHNIDMDEYLMLYPIENNSRDYMIDYYKKVVDIGDYLHKVGICDNLIFSMSFELKESRAYLLEIMPNAHLIYLHNGSNFEGVFDVPSKNDAYHLDTRELSIDQSLQKIVQVVASNTFHNHKNISN